MKNIKYINLGAWDNYQAGESEREEGIEKLIVMVEKYGRVKVLFDYEGFTKEEMVGMQVLRIMRERGYDGLVGYRQGLTVFKKN